MKNKIIFNHLIIIRQHIISQENTKERNIKKKLKISYDTLILTRGLMPQSKIIQGVVTGRHPKGYALNNGEGKHE